MHSNHRLSALLVRQQQAMPLEQQHSKVAMLLVVQLSSQLLLADLSRVQGLEEDLGALGLLLAALPQLNLLRRQILACGRCADDVIVISVHQMCAIDRNCHCACNCTANKSYVHSMPSKQILSFEIVQACQPNNKLQSRNFVIRLVLIKKVNCRLACPVSGCSLVFSPLCHWASR